MNIIQSINKHAIKDYKIIKCQSYKVSMKSSGLAMASRLHSPHMAILIDVTGPLSHH